MFAVGAPLASLSGSAPTAAVLGVAQEQAQADFTPFLPGLIVLLPLIGFLLNGALALVSGRRAADALRDGAPADHRSSALPGIIGSGVVLAAFAVTLANFLGMFDAHLGEAVTVSYWTWMVAGSFSVDAALQLDQLSTLMALVVTGVGFLIHVFSIGYMRADPGYARYFSYLNLFVAFMLVLVLGSSYALMFVGWEGVGLCSYLLIGFWFRDREKGDAGKKAFIVNRIGDFGFLVGMFLLFGVFGTLDYAEVFSAAPGALEYGGGVATAITLFLFLGAVGKSAQIPLHVWLPDAMAGPTPVSALIHAATMVTAGVYMIARSSALYSLAPASGAAVAVVGALTAIFAATIALKQYDIKKVLAYSTVSQLGYMFVAVGVGAYTAGVFHLVTHAFFKALLFLGAGAVIHSMHEAYHATHSHEDAQDMRNMGGLSKRLPVVWITMWVATLAIAGIWPFAGFFSKDEIIWKIAAFGGAERAPYPVLYTLIWVISLAAALLTAFYMTRMMVMTFSGANRTGKAEWGHLKEAPAVMWLPLVLLAALSIGGGWMNVPEEIRQSFLGLGPLTSEWLHHWLEPVTAVAHSVQDANLGELAHAAPFGGGELDWAVVSTLLALAVVLLTFWSRSRREVTRAAEAPPLVGFGKVLNRKWYVDESYDAAVVRPLKAASRFCWKVIDAGVIDGIVNGVGHLARGAGVFVSFVQNGGVNRYALVVTIGVLVILAAQAL